MARKILASTVLATVVIAYAFAITTIPAIAAQDSQGSVPQCGASALPSKVLVAAPPTGSKGADDLTLLVTPGLDSGKPVLWTAYQNGIGADGSPSTTGATKSTVAGFDLSTGAMVQKIQVTGKVDGLTAWPAKGELIATVNEDDYSAFNLLNPLTGGVTTYTYSPNPAVSGNGGTDSIAIHGDKIIVIHSNPNDLTQATEYWVTLSAATLAAKLTPVFYDNSPARDSLTGATVQLALTDPDTNFVMPHAGERFGGTLATLSQGDGQIVFASHHKSHLSLWLMGLTDNVAGNVPPVDGIAVATSGQGTLYVVDNGAGKIYALDTSACQKGTIFLGEPKDNNNPLVGTLNPWTGHITPLTNGFTSPKGLLFVPATDDAGDE